MGFVGDFELEKVEKWGREGVFHMKMVVFHIKMVINYSKFIVKNQKVSIMNYETKPIKGYIKKRILYINNSQNI
jgi:hypothetical protein